MAEQLICNQQVDGSTPFTSSTYGRVPERPMGADCKSVAFASMVRIHLLPPNSLNQIDLDCFFFWFLWTLYRGASLPCANLKKNACAETYPLSAGKPAKKRKRTSLASLSDKQLRGPCLCLGLNFRANAYFYFKYSRRCQVTFCLCKWLKKFSFRGIIQIAYSVEVRHDG